jgi:hypothetical protein
MAYLRRLPKYADLPDLLHALHLLRLAGDMSIRESIEMLYKIERMKEKPHDGGV